MRGITITAYATQHEKESSRQCSQQYQNSPAPLRIDLINRAECVARGHHSYPGNQRIEHHHNGAGEKPQHRECLKCLVKNDEKLAPNSRHRALWSTPTLNMKSIEQVVKEDEHQTKCSDDAQRQMNENCEDDHRYADYPNHLHYAEESIIDIESYCNSYPGKFQKDEPQSPGQQKARQGRLTF